MKACLVALLGALAIGMPTHAQQNHASTSHDGEPSTAEVMSSPQVQQAMSAAMQVLQQMDQQSHPGGNKVRSGQSAGQSDAMRDAASVARQAFGFAAENPNATEAEKQAAANRMMQGVFQQELQGDAQPSRADENEPAPIHQQAKDYGNDDGD